MFDISKDLKTCLLETSFVLYIGLNGRMSILMEPIWRDRKLPRSTWRYGLLRAKNNEHTAAFIKLEREHSLFRARYIKSSEAPTFQ